MSDFVQNPPGTYITIGFGVLLILAVFLPDMLGKKKKVDEQEQTAVQTEEIDAVAEENKALKEEIERLRAEMSGKNDQ